MGLLALFERGFGLHAPASAQLWIVPLGLGVAVAMWRSYAWLRPVRSGETLTIAPARLTYREPGKQPEVVERSGVSLVDVSGEDVSGRYSVVVYNLTSAPVNIWNPRWAGWKPERVVGALRRAGYPAARHSDIFDGRFQQQTVGLPPRTAR